jgi:hypothetical protein
MQIVQSADTPAGWVSILLLSPYTLRSDWAYWQNRIGARDTCRGDPAQNKGQEQTA